MRSTRDLGNYHCGSLEWMTNYPGRGLIRHIDRTAATVADETAERWAVGGDRKLVLEQG